MSVKLHATPDLILLGPFFRKRQPTPAVVDFRFCCCGFRGEAAAGDDADPSSCGEFGHVFGIITSVQTPVLAPVLRRGTRQTRQGGLRRRRTVGPCFLLFGSHRLTGGVVRLPATYAGS